MDLISAKRYTTLVFDWGNTLMEGLPYSGPMAGWPEVAVIDGVHEVLSELRTQYRLVIATNAVESSSPEQVITALERGGLDHYFDEVFTHSLLGGALKPARKFFWRLQRALNEPDGHILMIGDKYPVDVAGAVLVGWPVVWFNPAGNPCPGLLPIHSAEITHMSQLPEAIDQSFYPNLTEVATWLLEYGSTAALLSHVQCVASLAYVLAVWLRNEGQLVNPVLAHRGGMLHDLCKILSDENASTDHGQRAYDWLIKQGQPELAEIARRHLIMHLVDDLRPRTWEEKLVYYSDKLVEGGRIVPLEERIRALQGRYPEYHQSMEDILPALRSLEAEITRAAGLRPGTLVNHLRQAFIGEKQGSPG